MNQLASLISLFGILPYCVVIDGRSPFTLSGCKSAKSLECDMILHSNGTFIYLTVFGLLDGKGVQFLLIALQ
jgi:hypothetical protein